MNLGRKGALKHVFFWKQSLWNQLAWSDLLTLICTSKWLYEISYDSNWVLSLILWVDYYKGWIL